MTDREQTDQLADLFEQLPEEGLPMSFQANVMRQIRQEAVRQKQRKARLEWICVIIASLTMIGLATAALLYLGGLPSICSRSLHLGLSGANGLRFYLFIGVLGLILLFADYRLRQAFHKDE